MAAVSSRGAVEPPISFSSFVFEGVSFAFLPVHLILSLKAPLADPPLILLDPQPIQMSEPIQSLTKCCSGGAEAGGGSLSCV